jgi:hypothetical protein
LKNKLVFTRYKKELFWGPDMRGKLFALWFLLSLLCSGCLSGNLARQTSTPVPLEITAQPTSSPSHSGVTFTPTITQTRLATITKTQKVVKTATPTTTPQCPELLPAGSPTLLNGGSVLISEFPGNPEGIYKVWGLSSKTREPFEFFQHSWKQSLFFNVSPDGKKLVWHDFSKEPEELVVYDLLTGREQSFPYLSNWKNIEGWIDDQTLRINIETSSNLSKGIQKIYAVYDIQSRTVETETLNLDLPNYSFYPTNPWWGFASLDPKEELVLYTACEHSNCNVVLRNIHTGQEAWKSENGYKDYAPASWSKDGERAAFSIMSPDGQESRLVLITRDGKDVKTYSPLPKEREIRDVGLSPDGQYVYFAEWWSSSFGPGHILDADTGEFRNICTPGYLFGSEWWLPESNQLVYTVRKGNDPLDLGIMELRILDLDSWTTQVLVTGTNKEMRYYYIGWTPIEFP